MSEYEKVCGGKLVLKCNSKKRKMHTHKSKANKKSKNKRLVVDEDALRHGGWGKVNKPTDIIGTVAIEFGEQTYLKALDNGLFTVGGPHSNGEPPAPEEILTAFQVNENKVVFKSGYGKYLKIEKDGMVTGRSDAVGSMEQWEGVFQDNNVALQSELGTFMSIDPESDSCVALSKQAGRNEFITVRTSMQGDKNELENENAEEKEDLTQLEMSYVKKFQKFQNKKLLINSASAKELETARSEGNLHEALLNRRSKMKSDRYCK